MAKRIYKRDSRGRFAPTGAAKGKAGQSKKSAQEQNWPSIKDAKPSTDVKYFEGLGWAPTIKGKARGR